MIASPAAAVILLFAVAGWAVDPPPRNMWLQDPRSLRIDDDGLRQRFQGLFESPDSDSFWPQREVAWIRRRGGDRGIDLLANRLCFREEEDPWHSWGKKEGEVRRLRERWRIADGEIKKAILREFRGLRLARLFVIHRDFLQQTPESDLALPAALNALLLDPRAAGELVIRLIDPSAANALPAAADPVLRAGLLATLAALRGLDDPLVRKGLEHALLRTTGEERLSALRLLRGTNSCPVTWAAINRLLDEAGQGDLKAEDRAALALALGACPGEMDARLEDRLMPLVLAGQRDLAIAAAGALRSLDRPLTPASAALLADRLRLATDLALQRALVALLAGRAPAALTGVLDPESPWTGLIEHRRLVRAWVEETGIRDPVRGDEAAKP